MKKGMFGFTRKEVLWFAVLFFSSIILGVVSVAGLINKYYRHNSTIKDQISNYSRDLWNIQEITLYAVNTQRSSLNMIIYAGDSVEMKNVYASVQKNLDSLELKLAQLEIENRLNKTLRENIEQKGQDYIKVNASFLEIAAQKEKKLQAANFNIQTMRPILRRFNAFTRQTGEYITQKIQKTTTHQLNIFSQFEFWLLLVVLTPYVYFVLRFLYLILKMIFWDLFL